MDNSNSITTSLPLHECLTLKTNLIINRLHMFFTGIAILSLLHYRLTTFSHIIKNREEEEETPISPYLLISISELVFTFFWVLRRPARWIPVKRFVYPERLPKEDDCLPPVDVFICTADPSKEPSLGVMNTVLSAMALDYPSDKLSVYLSDDGGSWVTLEAMREAWRFGTFWVPFCRKYNLKTRCPDAFFSTSDEFGSSSNSDFGEETIEIEERYNEFKESLEKNSVNASSSLSRDHSSTVEVMSQEEMPYLVYVAREKRPSHPHHFKGGALNVLLKVSSVISNSPYFLVLDCDHYCNDPTSARQAMCFYLDPKISPNLAWVQFPQKFHNTSAFDIYDGRLHALLREGVGWDALRGPSIYGCNFYMSREAIYGIRKFQNDLDLNRLRKLFGLSNELIKSINKTYKPNISKGGKVSDALQKEIQVLASCTYDIDTEWGNEVGYAYFSVVEDSITSLNLHIKGWISVFINPKRPCFLGSCTTNLNDTMIQQTRWSFGLTQIALSKYCPLFYGPLRMSFLQSMSYAVLTLDALCFVAFYGIAIVPQICLLHDIALYPKVSDPFFVVFVFIFLSSVLKHVQEVYSFGDSIAAPLYEQRLWMMKSASCHLFGTWNAIMDSIGMREANFSLTSKVVDDEQIRLYEKGIYDFQVTPILLAPCCILYVLNLVSFVIGTAKILRSNTSNEMFIQAFIPLFGIIVNYHLLEGMVLRKDKGRISPFISLISVAVTAVILGLGSLILV